MSLFSRNFNKSEISTFLHKTFVSNSHLFVLYSEKSHLIQNGNATNWNSTGYFEVYHPVCKYSVKCLTKSFTVSSGQ